uniref:Uncharacterized protein n=1 Tax=mine drainage metagenome TaxID=410659 RepID=E6Q0S7_9ZZZZ
MDTFLLQEQGPKTTIYFVLWHPVKYILTTNSRTPLAPFNMSGRERLVPPCSRSATKYLGCSVRTPTSTRPSRPTAASFARPISSSHSAHLPPGLTNTT